MPYDWGWGWMRRGCAPHHAALCALSKTLEDLAPGVARGQGVVATEAQPERGRALAGRRAEL
jgi:hypothetical protein